MWEETVVAYFKVLSHHSHGNNEDNYTVLKIGCDPANTKEG
jgi:hypothetical protein